MATSGTINWNLDVANIIEKAAKRAYPAEKKGALSAADAVDARACMNMVLTDLTNAGYALSQIEYRTMNLVAGQVEYVLDSDVLDIFDLVFAKFQGASSDPQFTETAMTRIDLAAYNRINNKEIQAYPSQFALHRGLDEVKMFIYPSTDSDDDEIRYWALTRTEDVTESNQDVDLPYRYVNTLISGTAYYMAMEEPEDSEIYEFRLKRLQKSYADDVELAFGEDRDRSSMMIYPSFTRR